VLPESLIPKPVDNPPLWITSYTRASETDLRKLTKARAGRRTGQAERPAAPREAGPTGLSRSFRAVAGRRSGAERRGQLAAGAGLLDELDELDEDDELEPAEDVEDDDVDEPEDEPAPTELLEDERLSVR
jgi:hypothetical protein